VAQATKPNRCVCGVELVVMVGPSQWCAAQTVSEVVDDGSAQNHGLVSANRA
jgi:hypothetical protein